MSAVAETTMAERAVDLARELGLYGQPFSSTRHGCRTRNAARGWPRPTSVSRRISTRSKPRFAFRTRVLDYLWAGLPIATTSGDVFGELIERERLGARDSAARRAGVGRCAQHAAR